MAVKVTFISVSWEYRDISWIVRGVMPDQVGSKIVLNSVWGIRARCEMTMNVCAVVICQEITVCNARIAIPALNGPDLAYQSQTVSSGVVCDHTIPAQSTEE